MASISIDWTNYSLVFPLKINLSDEIDRSQPGFYRRTQGSIVGVLTFPLGRERNKLSVSGGIGASLFAFDPGDNSGAYTWPFEDKTYYSAILGLSLSNMRRYPWELFGQGLGLDLQYRHVLDRESPRLEGMLRAAFEPYFPARLVLYGARDEYGMDMHGTSHQFSSAIFSEFASVEYSTKGITALPWIAGTQAEVRLFSAEIQNSLSHAYINRIFASAAYRALLYDRSGCPDAEGDRLTDAYTLAQSAVLRIGADISTILLTCLPFTITPYAWGAWKFSNLNDGDTGNDFMFGFTVGVSY
jgi:hypothetical protein